MRFDPMFLDELKRRCDIVDVISRYLPLKRSGSTGMVGLCPFHSEKTPSFSVSPTNQFFHCFGCGAGGDVITFVMKMENLDYPDAIAHLAKQAGLELPANPTPFPDRQTVKRSRLHEMNREAARFFHEQLKSAPAALSYLSEKRRLSPQMIRHFGLGYAPNGDLLYRHLKSRGFTLQEMIAGSLCRASERGGQPYDFFRGRVMFPILDLSGNVIAFGGRVLDDSQPKYLNSPDTPAFLKGRNLFALNFAKHRAADGLILCEGYMDVIALHAAGFTQALATLGTALTSDQARLLKRYTDRICLCYDSDTAGQKATSRAIALLGDAGLDVTVLQMEDAKDPDEYIKKFGRERFGALLKESLSPFDYKMTAILREYDLLLSEDKIKAARAACEMILTFPSPIQQEVYLDRAAARLGLERSILKEELGRARRSQKRKGEQTQFRQVLQQAQGFGDKVSPERAQNPRAVAAEESILGMLLCHSEYLTLTEREGLLCEEDFLGEFHRRVFSVWRAHASEGAGDLGIFNEDFSPDEMGRITALVRRQEGLSASEQALRDCIGVLKSARAAKEEDFAALLQRRRDENRQP